MTEAATIAPAPAPLKAPFLWFGGKSRAASVIWRAIAEAFDVSSSTVALGRQGAHVEGDGMKGAVNYLAAAVIVLRRHAARDPREATRR